MRGGTRRNAIPSRQSNNKVLSPKAYYDKQHFYLAIAESYVRKGEEKTLPLKTGGEDFHSSG